MRILRILPSLAPETGGPAKSIPALCRALAALGHDVVLWTTDWSPNGNGHEILRKISGGKGYTLRVFEAEKHWPYLSKPASRELLQVLPDAYDKFDVIHVSSLWNPLATFAMRAMRRAGVSYCLTPHGMLDPMALHYNPWKKTVWAWLWDRANVEHAALVHFTTTLEEERALKTGWRLHHTVMTPNIIDMEEWQNLPPPSTFEKQFPQVQGCEVILFVGRIHRIKALDRLLEAMVVVRKTFPKAMLVCVGPDNEGYQLELERRADALGLRGHLLFTGILRDENLKAAYSRADVFGLVSHVESFGMAAAEALACGLPVVLSEAVNLGQELPSGGPVLRIFPDPRGTGEALIASLKRSKNRGKPDPEARALAREKFGQPAVGPLVDAYKKILDGSLP